MSLLTIRDLSLGYDSDVIVENLDFVVNKGDYLCIVGENGSGKSTLMRTLLHLQNPISGEILTGDSLERNEIGYLPQQTIVQKDFPASVWEIVLSGCLSRSGLRPFFSREEKKLAEENLKRLGIESLRNRCYRNLSRGQQQRVLLARALCATQKIILLDEPVSGLDPKVTSEMYALIDELHEQGLTVIMISHDLSAAMREASHVLRLRPHGWEFGTRAEFLNSDAGSAFSRSEGGDAR